MKKKGRKIKRGGGEKKGDSLDTFSLAGVLNNATFGLIIYDVPL